MTGANRTENPSAAAQSTPAPHPAGGSNDTVAAAPAAAAEAAPANTLTREEQMERFAQELKENDWGHQPC